MVRVQHTPLTRVEGATRVNIHDLIPQLVKQRASERLREVVGPHLLGWTVFDPQLSVLDSILDEEVTDVDVPRVLPTGGTTIGSQQDGALVVLV